MACSTTRFATVVKSWSLLERLGTALVYFVSRRHLADAIAELHSASNWVALHTARSSPIILLPHNSAIESNVRPTRAVPNAYL